MWPSINFTTPVDLWVSPLAAQHRSDVFLHCDNNIQFFTQWVRHYSKAIIKLTGHLRQESKIAFARLKTWVSLGALIITWPRNYTDSKHDYFCQQIQL